MILYKFGRIFRTMFPGYLWKVSTNEKVIYLTFDDGPIPEVTEYVLDLLKKHGAKATFFCVGENIKKHPEVFKRVVGEGHAVGNHTYNHLKGIDTEDDLYLRNVEKCQEEIEKYTQSKLMRPPYGKAKKSQTRVLREEGYKIVMWDVLSNDFMEIVSAETCLMKSKKHTQKGSVVLFHDSVKTFEKIKEVLPQYLTYFIEKGFQFKTL